ncbi:MAG: ABC transporter substrate-binding protein [Eubacteriaceae bacterium]|jgi:peptide/nickel transport system substrate-binding protein|nr:ABC transporter substrate-binding protein [Eubacteriaceae bacterium]
MKKKLSIFLVVLLIAVTLAGCGGSSGRDDADKTATDSADGKKTVVIGAQTDLVTLDPGHMYEPYANMFAYAAYDNLYTVKSETLGEYEPSVATGYTLDDSKTQYTFTLRDDVVFASGNPLTSKDVVWSYNRVLNMPESNAHVNMKNVKKVEAPDDYTVVITLAEPEASFLNKITSNAYAIVDSEVVKEQGGSDTGGDTAKTYLDGTSAGSGPFIIKEWTPKERVVMERNPSYWGTPSEIDQIIVQEMTSVDSQITALKNGEIDIALSLNQETAKQLEGIENVTIKQGETALMTFLVMSRDTALSEKMANPKVQEAVRYALDYPAYLTMAGEGASIPLNIVQNGFVGALERDENFRDLDKAKALMQEAGYEDGFNIILTCANNNSEGLEWTTIAQKVKEDLAEIDIDVSIETLEATLVYEKMRNAEMAFYLMFWSPDYYDINNQFAFLPGLGENGTIYGNRAHWDVTADNQELVDLGSKIYVEDDANARAALSEDLQRAYEKDSPIATLLQHTKTIAYNSERLANCPYNDLCKIELHHLKLK